MKILITGAAGFIGYHLSKKLITRSNNIVIGVDNLNDYYDINLKKQRLKSLSGIKNNNFFFLKTDIANYKNLKKIFNQHKIDIIINLAAQAGVRYSMENPREYFNSNLLGFFNLLDLSKKYKIKHLISASTSSVYGEDPSMRLKASKPADHPIQFYAATKRSTEIMGHSYSHIHGLPITMLRFFTVYGPWGRPDMSLFLFVKNIINKKKIKVFNFGNHSRDFTYIDDIVDGICLVIKKKPTSSKKNINSSNSTAPFKILNLGRGKKVKLMNFINEIEKNLKIKAKINYLKKQKGDVQETLSDISETKKYINYNPKIDIEMGIKKFINWYKSYYIK